MVPEKKQHLKQWDEHSLYVVQKKGIDFSTIAHSQNILGVTRYTSNTFMTSSEDKTLRLWDVRTNSSVKLIKNPLLTDDLSNPQTNGDNIVYVGSQKNVHAFDLRKQDIFIQEIKNTAKEPHLDNISFLKYSQKHNELLACDEEGDIRSYSSELQCLSIMDQMHKNICNSVDFLEPETSKKKFNKICVSGGFDSNLLIWDIQEGSIIKQINLQQTMAKNKISIQNYPFIHSIYCHKSWIIIAEENGHIICYSFNELNKPKFIMPASLTRVNCCKIASFNEKILITTSIDGTFSLFDFIQRKNGDPTFIQKYKTPGEPISIETMENNIILAMNSPSIAIFNIKG